MARSGMIYFMYHELGVPGRRLCDEGKGYTRYVVGLDEFKAQLTLLRGFGVKGMSVGEALSESTMQALGNVITFDDGCETDLTGAAPALMDAKFKATFYVVVGWLGKQGFLSCAQVRELSGLGFEIGCHSMTHAFLNDLNQVQLRTEIVEAKERLEQLIGRAVSHFSCPGGRSSKRIARIAKEAGYLSVATSRIGTNSATADPYRLARVAVLRGTSRSEFEGLCRGEGFFYRDVQFLMFSLGKSLLGNWVYEEVRNVLLGKAWGR